MDTEKIYRRAIENDLKPSKLSPWLIDAAIAIVPTIPTSMIGMPYCEACESVLCGACGHCHMIDSNLNHPDCPGYDEDMGADCAAWFQAYRAVWNLLYREDREKRGL